MLYSETSYPDAMTELPEDVRSIAIQTANDMFMDGDVRHHEDLIVLIAIQKAKEQLKKKSDRN